jgi:hypothetical protein
LLLLLATACGCTKPPAAPPPGDEEPRIRARFEEFRDALQARDAERLWAMLSRQSQADAERAARTLRTEHDKADPQSKAEQEKELGLSAADLSKLTGRDLMRTRPFQERYEEARDGKFERASVKDDNATVYFRDDEGDREKLIMLREGEQWKLWLKVPTLRRAAEKGAKEEGN